MGLLMLLALISYSRADQANTDIRPNDLIGLFTNDDAVRAKFDVTQNWVGLLGAIIANFLINGTVGFAALVIPALSVLWGIALVRNTTGRKLALITSYVLLGAMIFASFIGTLQRIAWMPPIPMELSGNIGQFVSSIFSHLIGTAGGLLLFAVAGFIVTVVAFDADIHRTLMRVKLFVDTLRDKYAARKAERDAVKKVEAEAKAQAAKGEQMELIPTAQEEENEEPARLLRRQARKATVTEEPLINRPEKPATAVPPANRMVTKPLVAKEDKKMLTPEDQKKFVESQMAEETTINDKPVVPQEISEEEADAPLIAETGEVNEIGMSETSDENETESAQMETAEAVTEDEPAKPSLTLRVQETEEEEKAEEATVADFVDEEISYTPPTVDLLNDTEEEIAQVSDEELKEHARILQEKLATFNVMIEDVQVTPGPVVTLYEFVPAAGIKISQIESLQDDIALAMKAKGIRIIAPIPGKGTVGVEIPNDKPVTVRMRGLVSTAAFRDLTAALPLALGKTTVGETFFADLAAMPHLLIAGATGSGKSVGINSMLLSILYKRHPSEVKFVIIDPKKIELSTYRALRNHFLAVCPDVNEDILTTPQNAVIALKSTELEMERRYDLLAKAGVRHITDYNQRIESGRLKSTPDTLHHKMPYLVVVIDELADLMITAAHEVEEPIARLAQLARAVGIHLLVATQRPSVDVITGVIKANFASRVAYAVASRIDSRTILDGGGAEQLLGKGDMLYLSNASPKPIRLQNPLITTEEIDAVVEHIASQHGYSQPYILPSVVEKKRAATGVSDSRDELFDEAARLVVHHQQGSVSLIQRRLKVGYSRAARIIDELEMAGIVGPFDGSKAREVLIDNMETLDAQLG
jgi:S-DNA-T family DNA segregation ATPase FtsK/SpoIIIE